MINQWVLWLVWLVANQQFKKSSILQMRTNWEAGASLVTGMGVGCSEAQLQEITTKIPEMMGKIKSTFLMLSKFLEDCTSSTGPPQSARTTNTTPTANPCPGELLVWDILDKLIARGKNPADVLMSFDGQPYMEETDINNLWADLSAGQPAGTTQITHISSAIIKYTPATATTSASISFNQGANAVVVNEVIKNVIIGETPQKPGLNADGVTIPDDFKFGDSPQNPITNDPLFTKSNTELINIFEDMVELVSTVPLENELKEMISRFSNGFGGTFRSQILNDAVHGTEEYNNYYLKQVQEIQKVAGGLSINSLKTFPAMTLDRLSFPTFSPIFGQNMLPSNGLINGLVIAIHQVWAAKVEFKNVFLNKDTKIGKATMVFTLYDHFGLDAPDIVKFGDKPFAGDGFKAWYILQHYRNAKPFVTEVKISYPISISFK